MPVVGPFLQWLLGIGLGLLMKRLEIDGAKLVVRFDDQIKQAAWEKAEIDVTRTQQTPGISEEEKRRALEEAKKRFDLQHTWSRP